MNISQLYGDIDIYGKSHAFEEHGNRGFSSLINKADEGDITYMNYVAFCYEHGEGVEKKLEEAVKWYQRAADKSDGYAMYCLGRIYADKKDFENARQYYQKSSDAGCKDAVEAIKTLPAIIKESNNILFYEVKEVQEKKVVTSKATPIQEEPVPQTKKEPSKIKNIHLDLDVEGYVTQLDENGVRIEFGFKKEGIVTYDEWSISEVAEDIKENTHIGDWVKVKVIGGSGEDGYIKLSKKAIDSIDAWRKIKPLNMRDNKEVYVKVLSVLEKDGKIKGLNVGVEGVVGFMPASCVDSHYHKNFDKYIGKKLKAEIDELDIHRKNIVLTRSNLLSREKILNKASNGNLPDDQFRAGMMYLEGKVCKQSYPNAIQWLNMAAMQEHAEAQYVLGIIYYYGYFVTRDKDYAIKYFTRSAINGNFKALFPLSNLQVENIKDINVDDKVFEAYDSANDLFYTGNKYIEGLNLDQKYSIRSKNTATDYKLFMYLDKEQKNITNLENIQPSIEKAIRYWKKAADAGCDRAYYNLAWCYYHGVGQEADIIKAFKYYIKAAELGNVYAQNNIACFYICGIATAKNANLAAMWFDSATQKEVPIAQYNLAICYLEGQGVAVNNKLAIELLQNAAKADCVYAQYKLSEIYKEGSIVDQNVVLSEDLLKQVIDKKIPNVLEDIEVSLKNHAYHSYADDRRYLQIQASPETCLWNLENPQLASYSSECKWFFQEHFYAEGYVSRINEDSIDIFLSPLVQGRVMKYNKNYATPVYDEKLFYVGAKVKADLPHYGEKYISIKETYTFITGNKITIRKSCIKLEDLRLVPDDLVQEYKYNTLLKEFLQAAKLTLGSIRTFKVIEVLSDDILFDTGTKLKAKMAYSDWSNIKSADMIKKEIQAGCIINAKVVSDPDIEGVIRISKVDVDESKFKGLLKCYGESFNLKTDEIIDITVSRVTEDGIYTTFKEGLEGRIDLNDWSEIMDEKSVLTSLKAGTTARVKVMPLTYKATVVTLSKVAYDRTIGLAKVKAAEASGESLRARVINTEGHAGQEDYGLKVEVEGIRGFIPEKYLEIPITKVHDYGGKTLDVVVISMKNNKIILAPVLE